MLRADSTFKTVFLGCNTSTLMLQASHAINFRCVQKNATKVVSNFVQICPERLFGFPTYEEWVRCLAAYQLKLEEGFGF